MLAGDSFSAANFLSRDWHFPPHSRRPALLSGLGAGPWGATDTHTPPAQPRSVDNIVIIRRGLWNPEVHSPTTALVGE